MKVKITGPLLKKLRTQGKPRERYFDTKDTGFFVRVLPGGQLSFGARYGDKKHRKEITVGKLGEFTLHTARIKAQEYLRQSKSDRDPAAEKLTRRSIPTLKEWQGEYLDEITGRLSAPWIRETKRYLKIACADLGSKPLDKVTVDDVARFFQARKDEGPTTANRALAALRACLAAAWRRELIPDNPAAKVRSGQENPPRSRVLTDAELGRFLKELDKHKDPHIRAAFRLLIEAGVRRSEVLRARWEDFDLEGRTWRLPRPKSQHPEVVPLTDELVALLEGLPRDGAYLLPGRKKKGQPESSLAGPRKTLYGPWTEIKKAAGLEDVTPHDLRRTFGLHVARTAGLHVASKLLRHSDIRVTERVYAPLGLAALREAVESTSKERKKRLLRVVNGGAANDQKEES